MDHDEHQHVEKDVNPATGQGPDHVTTLSGVVTCDDARCSQVGVKILNENKGHAVDAAIATALCLGVVSPTESGIGGGGFMVIRCASSFETEAIDMRETAPDAAYTDMYEDDPEAQEKGALSIAVPGELRGMRYAWEKYGRVEWKTLFEQAIDYANNGFEVSEYLAKDLEDYQTDILDDPGLRKVYAPQGTVLVAGDTCYNKKLGKTLQAVSEDGPDAIYNGSIGKKLVKELTDKGGILTFEDLNNYKVKVTNVTEADIFGYKILGMPPPSCGTVGLAMIGHVLDNYGSAEALEGSLGLHRFAEATKYMLGMKMDLGDPDFSDISKYVAQMLSLKFAKKIWKKIRDDKTYEADHYDSRYKQIIDNGTSHLGVIDHKRNAVAFTSTINDVFGSKILSVSTGIVLNNQMRDFSTPAQEREFFNRRVAYMSQFPAGEEPEPYSDLPPAIANLIEPGKRPLSSMTPLIILKDGELVGVIGGSGGPNITPAVAQVFLKHFVFQMDPRSSVHTPRIYPKLLEKFMDYEDLITIDGEHIKLSDVDKKFLEGRGHVMTIMSYPVNCHPIVQDFRNLVINMDIPSKRLGILTAEGDPRKNAKPAAQPSI